MLITAWAGTRLISCFPELDIAALTALTRDLFSTGSHCGIQGHVLAVDGSLNVCGHAQRRRVLCRYTQELRALQILNILQDMLGKRA
ncbi:hypothetical protein EM20IM_01525 [Candidatus Methylacidiphilum infernorum]|uniref:Uncharacterized protein n=1 Tax=Candidatus Methylacidiphilum infernorum TaxID=511746 RepID=A0ABX7PWL8_9BACT|nr:hypothetical protein [Candidatus Methylacidiphilum infernorum]QSR87068.1 hypothetical protein EM20IM_01525 [Candidatus Methylacidiphilum infernorum]